MEKITKEQIEKLTGRSRGKNSILINFLASLNTGETGFISHAEWKKMGYKSKLSGILNCYALHPRSSLNGKKYSVRTYKEGMTVQRIK